MQLIASMELTVRTCFGKPFTAPVRSLPPSIALLWPVSSKDECKRYIIVGKIRQLPLTVFPIVSGTHDLPLLSNTFNRRTAVHHTTASVPLNLKASALVFGMRSYSTAPEGPNDFVKYVKDFDQNAWRTVRHLGSKFIETGHGKLLLKCISACFVFYVIWTVKPAWEPLLKYGKDSIVRETEDRLNKDCQIKCKGIEEQAVARTQKNAIKSHQLAIATITKSYQDKEEETRLAHKKMVGHLGEAYEQSLQILTTRTREEKEELLGKISDKEKDINRLNMVANLLCQHFAPEVSLSQINGVHTASLKEGSKLGSEKFQALGQLLEHWTEIKKLSLSGTHFGSHWDNEKGRVALLAHSLKTNSHLEELDLGNSYVCSRDIQYIADLIRINTTLKSLNLYNSYIGDNDADALLKALCDNEGSALKNIGLESTRISEEKKKKFSESGLQVF